MDAGKTYLSFVVNKCLFYEAAPWNYIGEENM